MHISSPSSRVTGIIKWLGLMYVSACLLNGCAMQHKPSLMLHGYIGLDPCKIPVTEMQLYFALGNFGLGGVLLYLVVKVFCPKIIFWRCEVWGRNLLFQGFGLGDFLKFALCPSISLWSFLVNRNLREMCIALLYNHRFWLRKGLGGIGWQSHCFLNATESCLTVYI